jgi:hypothetical protein
MSRIIFIIKKFPYNKPVFNGSYKQLIGSLFTLIKEQPLLREATLINVFSFALVLFDYNGFITFRRTFQFY